MFERVIFNIIKGAIDDEIAHPLHLRRMLTSPGWEDGSDGSNDEIQKLADGFTGDLKPSVVLNYPRDASSLPCYAIVLGSENEADVYLGHDIGFVDENAQDIVNAVEAERGSPVEAKVRRYLFRYIVYVYTEHPDVTLAYYNFLKNAMHRNDRVLEEACFEDPKYSGNDLMPQQNYLPTNTYVRQLTIEGNAHILYTEDLDLGPFAIARGKRVSGVHINNRATGVDAKVEVYVDEE